MPISRWKFVYGVDPAQRISISVLSPIKPGPEVDAFTVTQNKLLEKFDAGSLEVTTQIAT